MGRFKSNSRSASLWLYNAPLDLIVGCGAWSAPLLLVSYFAQSTSARTWSIAFYVLALFFNYPHYMATIYRAYHRAEDFHKYRVFTVHITALLGLTLLLSHHWVRILPWIFTVYLTWSPWHYSGQNYGLFMMFARRAGADPDQTTRRALYGAFITSYLVLFLGFHTGPSTDPLFLSLGIPPVISRVEQMILCAAFLVLSVFGLSRLARQTGWRKLTPSLTLFSSQFLWFLLPSAISLIKGLEIPQSRYSSGVLAVMHSAQYLWITSYYARREAGNAAGDDRAKVARDWRPFAYFGVLVLGGIALFVPGPWLASRAFHHDFTASFLIFTALINIHHFILDGAIWKLRDGRIASLLLNPRLSNTKDRITGAAAEARGQFASACRWLVGAAPGARALRVSAAVLLLAWGTVDQARYYLALHAGNLNDLRRAAAMDSFDSTLQMRLADTAMKSGQPEQAEAAWRRALQSNPADPAPRQALLRFLIERNRFDEASKLIDSSLNYAPKDANLLVDQGLLALQAGHANVARAAWEKAIAVDPKQTNAHLYLASELDREGDAPLAAAHYTNFLEQISRQPAHDRPEPEEVIAVALRLADCDARSSQTESALKAYHLAERLSAQVHQPRLESAADINEAALEARMGKLDEALQLYQHALGLDQISGEAGESAADWSAYGTFLDSEGFPKRLAYACLVKAQQMSQSLRSTPVPDPASDEEKNLEKQLGAEAGAIRRNPEPVLSEALLLRR
jgi:tetratricopeptide (TPR) repeat protein